MNRREFILAAGAFSLAPSMAATDSAAHGRKIDKSLAVIVSDSHICGDRKWHANDEAVKTLNQILALDPLPAKMKSFAQKTINLGPLMRGYIHGHRHSWMLDALHAWDHGGRLVRSVGIPSASLWGDIGFVAVRDKGDHAEFKLHQRDCFFPSPDIKREKSWDLIREENDGKTIKILYR